MVECSECEKFYDCLYGGELVGRLTSCPDFQQKPKTNADRIRAMSDEELADIVVCPHTGNWDLCRDDCKKCRLEWLKQPAEG